MIKVLIAEDNKVLNQDFQKIIEDNDETTLVASVDNGLEALELCKVLKPDLVLMDIEMPIMDGITSTKLIKEYNPAIKILILTIFQEEKKVLEAINNGADGYILKDIDYNDLISAIKTTQKGFRLLDSNVFDKVLNPTNNTPLTTQEVMKKFGLSERRVKIISLVAGGKTNKEIAKGLNVSDGYIRNEISRTLCKLNLKNRTELAIFAATYNI